MDINHQVHIDVEHTIKLSRSEAAELLNDFDMVEDEVGSLPVALQEFAHVLYNSVRDAAATKIMAGDPKFYITSDSDNLTEDQSKKIQEVLKRHSRTYSTNDLPDPGKVSRSG